MSTLKTLDNRVSYRVSRVKQDIFVRDDFADLAGYDQVGRSLRNMVKNGKLVKVGYGLYAKGRTSRFSGKVIPDKPLPELARQALERLNIETIPSSYERDYNEGRIDQVPTGRLIGIRGRFSRKMGFDGKYVVFERA